MRYIKWEGYIKLNSVVILLKTTTYKDIAKAIATKSHLSAKA